MQMDNFNIPEKTERRKSTVSLLSKKLKLLKTMMHACTQLQFLL